MLISGLASLKNVYKSAKAIGALKEIDGRRVAADWSLPREVYQEMKEKEEPEPEVEEEEEAEVEDEDVKEEPLSEEVTATCSFVY